jgi:putative transposase
LLFDRGYFDLKLFSSYCEGGIYFVSRLKSNVVYTVAQRRDVSKYKNISSDQIIEFGETHSTGKSPLRLRRIRVKDPETGKYIVLLTNNFNWSPKTISALYKDRWQVELFFKEIKQNLKIKRFLGTTKNAVLCQIWVAMIVYLLLAYLKFKSKKNWTISKLMKIIPIILSFKDKLFDWLNNPFGFNRPKPKNAEV